MLLIENLRKDYGSFTALENINLSFSQGVYGLLSPNGAGKTTLIKLIATLLFPTNGEITWNGLSIRGMDEEYRSLLGYLPQQFGYYRRYSPLQFLDYIGALKGMPKKKTRQRAEELLCQVGLENVLDKKMRKFSGGMVQRVGIAQALLNDPKILILDEPTAGLDPGERARFRNIIAQLSRDRIVILSTHIVSDIETVANRVIMLKERRVLYDAEPEALTEMLRGRVFEIMTEDAAFAQTHYILSEKQSAKGAIYRFLLEEGGAPPPEADAREAGLEDVFLAVYREESL